MSSALELGFELETLERLLGGKTVDFKGVWERLSVIDDQKKRFADRESGGQACQWERLRGDLICLAARPRVTTPPEGPAARGAPDRLPTETERLTWEYWTELRCLLRALAGPQTPWLDWGQTLGGAFWAVMDGRTPLPLTLPGGLTARDRKLIEGSFWPDELSAPKIVSYYKSLRRFLADHYAAFWNSPLFQSDGNGGTFSIGLHEMPIRSQSNAVLAPLLAELEEAGWPERFVCQTIQASKLRTHRNAVARNLRPTLSKFLADQRKAGFDPMLRLSVQAVTGEIHYSVVPAAESQPGKGRSRKRHTEQD
jgi:hypothetical protein